MYREVSLIQLGKNYFLVGVLFFITILYSSLFRLFVFNPDEQQNILLVVLFVPLQISFVMLIWSMIRVIISDPGRVPLYYGVLMDDSETKKRRYCLICHIFKPDRCHHCSTCRRCVLNMDHHCPWIGNCVGYQNRKFFLLFLFYINITVFQSLLIVCIKLVPKFIIIAQGGLLMIPDQEFIYTTLQSLTSLLVILIFGVMIFNFMKFHINLVSENRTTIDTLEQKRNPQSEAAHNNQFDVGVVNNWYQVMGRNKLLWLLPIFGESGRPVGDGVHWERNCNSIVSEAQQGNQTNPSSGINQRRVQTSQNPPAAPANQQTQHPTQS